MTPYNPKSVNRGGNRGLDELFSRAPEKGSYRVVGVDTFDGGDWVQGDFDTLEEAKKCADDKSGQMCIMHVYDKSGNHLYQSGTF